MLVSYNEYIKCMKDYIKMFNDFYVEERENYIKQTLDRDVNNVDPVDTIKTAITIGSSINGYTSLKYKLFTMFWLISEIFGED